MNAGQNVEVKFLNVNLALYSNMQILISVSGHGNFNNCLYVVSNFEIYMACSSFD